MTCTGRFSGAETALAAGEEPTRPRSTLLAPKACTTSPPEANWDQLIFAFGMHASSTPLSLTIRSPVGLACQASRAVVVTVSSAAHGHPAWPPEEEGEALRSLSTHPERARRTAAATLTTGRAEQIFMAAFRSGLLLSARRFAVGITHKGSDTPLQQRIVFSRYCEIVHDRSQVIATRDARALGVARCDGVAHREVLIGPAQRKLRRGPGLGPGLQQHGVQRQLEHLSGALLQPRVGTHIEKCAMY